MRRARGAQSHQSVDARTRKSDHTNGRRCTRGRPSRATSKRSSGDAVRKSTTSTARPHARSSRTARWGSGVPHERSSPAAGLTSTAMSMSDEGRTSSLAAEPNNTANTTSGASSRIRTRPDVSITVRIVAQLHARAWLDRLRPSSGTPVRARLAAGRLSVRRPPIERTVCRVRHLAPGAPGWRATPAALRDCNSRRIADNCPAPTGPAKGDRR